MTTNVSIFLIAAVFEIASCFAFWATVRGEAEVYVDLHHEYRLESLAA